MNHLTAFSPLRVMRPLYGLFDPYILWNNFILGISLGNFVLGVIYLCLPDRFAVFGLLTLDGPPYGLRPILLDWPLCGLLVHIF